MPVGYESHDRAARIADVDDETGPEDGAVDATADAVASVGGEGRVLESGIGTDRLMLPPAADGVEGPLIPGRGAAADFGAVGAGRMLYIDNIRAVLISLVVVGHLAITYSGESGIGDWYFRQSGHVSDATAILMTMLLGIGTAFAMGLFFLIAGYFTPRPYDRKGTGRFLADRLVRLGIPLAFYALIINPLVTYWASVAGGYAGSFWRFVTTRTQDLTEASVGPLWFVEGLLIFSVIYALGRLASDRAGGSNRVKGATRTPGNLAISLFVLAVGLVTFVVRVWAEVGWQWEPPHLELAHFPQYAAMFAAGIVAYRCDWFVTLTDRQARPWGWVALACVLLLPVLAVAAGALEDNVDPALAGGFTWLSLAYSLWEASMCVSMSITALTLFRRRSNKRGRLAQTMGADAYAVYVLHPLIIVPLAILLGGVTWPLELMFLLAAPLGVALCFLIGHAVRRLPLVRQVL